MAMLTEPARKTKVAGSWDVIVIGGGIAGVSAAVAAARQGSKVALIEKEFGLGGLATLANVVMYLPLCDGYGRQVIAGIGEELLRLSVKDVKKAVPHQGIQPVASCWQKGGKLSERKKTRFTSSYNPPSFMIEMEALLAKEKVELLYDTRVCGCRRSGKKISHIYVENKSGRLALEAKAFIDASGDADLCAYVDCATDDIDGNVLCGWYYMQKDTKLHLQAFSNNYSPVFAKDVKGPFLSGLNYKDVTTQIVGTRQLVKKQVEKARKESPNAQIFPIMIPSIPSYRVTRRLDGAATLHDEDKHKWFDDAVGLTGDWRYNGPVWAISYGMIRTDKCPNLFAAGRCMSADLSVWDVTRVIPTCAVTGEAAGVAAALTVKDCKGDSGKMNICKLQKALTKKNVLLDPSLVKPAY